MQTMLYAAMPLVMLGLALPAHAQMKSVGQAPNTVPVQSSGSTTTTPLEGELGKKPDMGTTESTGDANAGKISKLMANGDAMARQVETISSVGTVRIKDATALGANADQVQSAYNANMAPISALQAAVAANTSLNAKIAAEKIEPMQIVAIEIEADGAVTVYTRDRAN